MSCHNNYLLTFTNICWPDPGSWLHPQIDILPTTTHQLFNPSAWDPPIAGNDGRKKRKGIYENMANTCAVFITPGDLMINVFGRIILRQSSSSRQLSYCFGKINQQRQ